jgi:hypothetical protein
MLATRKKPVDGYLLKQSVPKPSSSSSKKAKHQEHAGLFRKLFFSLDRDAGVLLYYTSQQEHANASSSAASSSSSSLPSGGPEGSIPCALPPLFLRHFLIYYLFFIYVNTNNIR